MTKTPMACLLTFAVLGAAPTTSADCGDLDDRCTYPDPSEGPVRPGGTIDCDSFDPGTPDGGAVGSAEWFAQQNAYLACRLAESVQNPLLLEGGNAAWKVGTVAAAGAALVDASGLGTGASAYHGAAMAVAQSEGHDACGALIGDANPLCGTDPGVSQAQACVGGATVPNPTNGGLIGNTLTNANGALQATCALQAVALAGLPSEGEAMDFAMEAHMTLLSLNGEVFDAGSAVLSSACVYLTGADPCI